MAPACSPETPGALGAGVRHLPRPPTEGIGAARGDFRAIRPLNIRRRGEHRVFQAGGVTVEVNELNAVRAGDQRIVASGFVKAVDDGLAASPGRGQSNQREVVGWHSGFLPAASGGASRWAK